MGVGFLTGPGVVLSRTEPADKVGQAILKLFPDCGAIVDHSRDFETPDSPVFKLANVSSWSKFRRQRPEYLTATMSATSIEVELLWRDGRGYAPASPRQLVVLPREVASQRLGELLIHGAVETDTGRGV